MAPSNVSRKKLNSQAARKSNALDGVKKRYRYRPRTIVLRDIRRYEKNISLLLKRLSPAHAYLFKFLMETRDKCYEELCTLTDPKSHPCIMKLKTNSRNFLVRLFESFVHNKHVAIRPAADVQLARRIHGCDP